MAQSKKKKPGKTGLFVCLWLLIAIILCIVFFTKKDEFVANLKAADFFERVVGKTPEFIQNYPEKEADKGTNGLLDVEVDSVPGPAETSDESMFNINNQASDNLAAGREPDTTDSPSQSEAQSAEESQKTDASSNTTEQPPKPAASTTVKLYFVSVGADGSVSRRAVSRQIPKSDAPLTNTIKALLTGPLGEDKNCMTLIPQGTRLLGATVRNGIATLNFSEEFEYNGIGAEGYRAQLMQIVFTATEFSTVESVQFFIEGQRKEYIGSGEDVWMWIGSPYSRSSFN